MARYRKIDPRMWRDDRFKSLGQQERLIAIYAMTAQSNRIGLFVLSPGEAAEDFGTSRETFLKGLAKVCERLKWTYETASRVLYIPTWWKYNSPENPNVLKSCLDDLHELPQTKLVKPFSENTQYLPERFIPTFTKGLAKVTCKNTQEQEQEQEQELSPASAAVSEPSGFAAFWEAYPKKREKLEAEKVWKQIHPVNGLCEKIIASVQAAKQSEDWRKENGRFIPNPAKYLRRGNWEDEHTLKLIPPERKVVY